MLHYLKPYWLWVILSPLTMIGEVFADHLQPKMMSSLVNDGVLGNDRELLLRVGLQMLLTVLLGGLSGSSCSVFASLASQNFACDLRKDVFKNAMALSFQQTDKFTTGSLITRLTNDITFKNVAFHYPGYAGRPVLKDISLTVKPGENIALLGPPALASLR